MLKKEGFLVKMGDVIKNWKKRFFVIDKNFLYYYEDDKAYRSKGIAASKGKIPLSGLTITAYPDKQYGKKYCFGVKANSGERTYVLVAADEAERTSWMIDLKEQDKRVTRALGIAIKATTGVPAKGLPRKPAGDPRTMTAQERYDQGLLEEEEEEGKLEVLGGLVGVLARQGDAIGREVDIQNKMLDEIDADVERTTDRIAKNTRLANQITRDA